MPTRTQRTLGQSLDCIERQLNRMWRDHDGVGLADDLSFNEYDYLRWVYDLGSPRLSDLAKEMNVSKPSATSMVQKLEKKGLLKRSPCPEDGRAIRLSITSETRRMFDMDKEIYGTLTRKISTALPKHEMESLERLLSKACNSIIG